MIGQGTDGQVQAHLPEPFPIVQTRIVAPRGDGRSSVTAVVEGDATGFFRLASPLLRLLGEGSVHGDYAHRLKAMLEKGS